MTRLDGGFDRALDDLDLRTVTRSPVLDYLRRLLDAFGREEVALMAYNAGPNRLRQLRREAAQRGLDPNVWFGNVERVASERIGRETVTYVSNIYKYYLTYKLVTAQLDERAAAKAKVRKGA